MQDMLTEPCLALINDEVDGILIESECIADGGCLLGKFFHMVISILLHHAVSVEILCGQLFELFLMVRTDADADFPCVACLIWYNFCRQILQIDRRIGWNLLMYAHPSVAVMP